MKPYLVFIYIVIICLFKSCSNVDQKVEVVPGISEELAAFRHQQVQDVIYNLTFDIPSEKTAPIPAKLILNLEITDVSQDLQLDFNEESANIQGVSIQGKRININHYNEHLIIPRDLLLKGQNEIIVEFNAGELSLNRNEDYLYTLLVPDRASTVFPCFDQPDIKARYQLTISAPENWKVLTSSESINTITENGRSTHEFGLSDPMSTYLFSFVAGVFNEAEEGNMNMLYRENDEVKIAESLGPIFNIHQQSLDFLEEYTNYDFAFQKLDFAAIPGFQYGGMEHVGAIQYRESSLFLDENATINQKLSRAKLIAHETAHMWFGDLVTMKWFNDVWMKEVFANFMADKIMNPAFPEINHDLQFMMGHYPRAYSEDRTQGTNPIRQNLPNLKNAGSLYGAIIYNKAPIMMRQLELLLGKEKFKKGIQDYIEKYAHDNADWNQLIEIFGGDTRNWSEVWVNSAGRPIFSDKLDVENDIIKQLTIQQTAEDGSQNIWPQSFSIGLNYGDSIREINIKSEGKSTVIREVEGLKNPESIIYNYNGLGYGVFPTSRQIIEDNSEVENEVARAYTYINAYENMLIGNINPAYFLGQILDDLNDEKNELIFNYLSGISNTIFWNYIRDEDQAGIQAAMENRLWNLLQDVNEPGIKKSIFGLYESIAYSEKGKENLYQIWNKSFMIDNLKLNENDYTDLAATLAIYKHNKSNEILVEALSQIKNPDRKERFEWLQSALSDNEAIRDSFMVSLKKPEMREKESWVGSALNYIHHPLRQSSSIKHVPLCLELLEEVQLTGDIFFPKRWLSASVGNYTSSEAYGMVEGFLRENPDFSPVLKRKLMQAVDDLYRRNAKIIN